MATLVVLSHSRFLVTVCYFVECRNQNLSFLSCLFKSEVCAWIDQNPWCSYYCKYLVGSGIVVGGQHFVHIISQIDCQQKSGIL